MPDQQIPLIDLKAQQQRLRPQIDAAVAAVFDHGKYIMGPEVTDLEGRLSEFCGAREVVSCSSGTDAIWLPLLAIGAGPGDAVLLPSFTFTATAEAVALCGATPVFVDIDPATFNIDPTCLEPAIALARQRGLNPKAIIPVDLFGLPADYANINPVARAHGLTVIGDAAQSFGGRADGASVGRLADMTATSFFPAKPLGCYGDGGAIFTDDPDLAEALRSIRVHGRGAQGKYDNVRVGTNARLDTVQAAVLLCKLDIFAEELDLRAAVANRYHDALAEVVEVPHLPAGKCSAWAQYTIRVDGRDRFAAALKERGVMTQIYYAKPLHLQRPYQDAVVPEAGLPETERAAGEVLSLPMFPYLTRAQQDRVIGAVRASASVPSEPASGQL